MGPRNLGPQPEVKKASWPSLLRLVIRKNPGPGVSKPGSLSCCCYWLACWYWVRWAISPSLSLVVCNQLNTTWTPQSCVVYWYNGACLLLTPPSSLSLCLSLMEGSILYCCTLMFILGILEGSCGFSPAFSLQPLFTPVLSGAAPLLSSHVLCSCGEGRGSHSHKQAAAVTQKTPLSWTPNSKELNHCIIACWDTL